RWRQRSGASGVKRDDGPARRRIGSRIERSILIRGRGHFQGRVALQKYPRNRGAHRKCDWSGIDPAPPQDQCCRFLNLEGHHGINLIRPGIEQWRGDAVKEELSIADLRGEMPSQYLATGG